MDFKYIRCEDVDWIHLFRLGLAVDSNEHDSVSIEGG